MIADQATVAIHPCGKVTGKGNPQRGKRWRLVPRKNLGLRYAISHKINSLRLSVFFLLTLASF